MGPISLYDKSFLEGLSLDEAVMFDVFFYPVTCPVFYVETLANLAKEKPGRSPENLVGAIANKFPQMHGAPNVHHKTLAMHNLCGGHVSMTGQIALAGGIPVYTDGKNNVVFKESPEAASFSRWQNGKFEEIEREFASGWRQELANLDLAILAERAKRYGRDLSSCKQIQDCHDVALALIDELPHDLQLALACELLNIPAEAKAMSIAAWQATGSKALKDFAPYAHYVVSIQIFFDIALATGKISSDRPSNFNDMAYLFYLPFCHVFISSDKLHRTCAPLFMRDGQQFVWGEDLKMDLRMHNEALLELPEDVRNQGLIRMSPKPIAGSLLDAITKQSISFSRSQDSPFSRPDHPSVQRTASEDIDGTLEEKIKQQVKQFHESREYLQSEDGELKKPAPGSPPPPLSKSESETLQERIQRIIDAADDAEGQVTFDPRDADSVTLERMVQRRRGSWFQIPHDIRD